METQLPSTHQGGHRHFLIQLLSLLKSGSETDTSNKEQGLEKAGRLG